MGWSGVTGAELMPSLVGGYTETVCSKLKNGNRFLKPNFETLPNWIDRLAMRFYK
jgi:hypothetical protein